MGSHACGREGRAAGGRCVCVMERMLSMGLKGEEGDLSESGVRRGGWDVDTRRRKAEHSFAFFLRTILQGRGRGEMRDGYTLVPRLFLRLVSATHRPPVRAPWVSSIGIVALFRLLLRLLLHASGTEQPVRKRPASLLFAIPINRFHKLHENTASKHGWPPSSYPLALLGGHWGGRRALELGVGNERA